MILYQKNQLPHFAILLKEEVVRKSTVSEYMIIIGILFMLLLSCSEKKTSVNITQYTNNTYVTGVVKMDKFVFCATKGGLIKWDTEAKKYEEITTAQGLITNVLTDVVIDGDNKIWVSSKEGMCRIDGKKVK